MEQMGAWMIQGTLGKGDGEGEIYENDISALVLVQDGASWLRDRCHRRHMKMQRMNIRVGGIDLVQSMSRLNLSIVIAAIEASLCPFIR